MEIKSDFMDSLSKLYEGAWLKVLCHFGWQEPLMSSLFQCKACVNVNAVKHDDKEWHHTQVGHWVATKPILYRRVKACN